MPFNDSFFSSLLLLLFLRSVWLCSVLLLLACCWWWWWCLLYNSVQQTMWYDEWTRNKVVNPSHKFSSIEMICCIQTLYCEVAVIKMKRDEKKVFKQLQNNWECGTLINQFIINFRCVSIHRWNAPKFL